MAKAKLMGILNLTPDSFYEKSRTLDVKEAIEYALQMQEDGADLLDIGGESSRPGSSPISESEELERVVPVIQSLAKKLSIPISIDTTKPAVAKAALDAGASLLNDISGFSHPDMVKLAKNTAVDICVMHMQGIPQTMQQRPAYQEGIVTFLIQWFKERTHLLIDQGVDPQRIILDPGIGFGKTVADNVKIIQNLPRLKQLGFRILLGVSRKSFLGKITGKQTSELLPATLAVNTLAVCDQVDFIRVHDIKEHRAMIDFIDAYQQVTTHSNSNK